MLDEIRTFLTVPADLWLVLATTLLGLLFVGLWLRAHARAGTGGPELRRQLRAAQNEIKLLKGDAIQARRDHAAELEKLNKELETLRAVAGGRVPPELEQWKKRAVKAEQQLAAQRERHRAQIEKIATAVGAGTGPVDRTMIAPGGVRERVEKLEHDLAQARRELEAEASRHQAELAALAERLSAEKAAALTIQARRHAAELEALRRQVPAAGMAADERWSQPPPAAAISAEPLAVAASGVSDSVRFPFLQVLAGAEQGARFYLPYAAATIGRSEANTVAIQETTASRTHAEILFDGIDFVLRDQNSTNGTFLNQNLVTSARLHFGDVIEIGGTRLRFSCEAFEAAATNPALAVTAFEAMVEQAPNCRSVLRGLARLLEQDPTRRDEASAASTKLRELDNLREQEKSD
ncbi:MAG TPA: FHA domain-containing protein [Geminicoccaceae bacterium]|nr:FHA domain-containing protein [Geminicoccaceae bacterium]